MFMMHFHFSFLSLLCLLFIFTTALHMTCMIEEVGFLRLWTPLIGGMFYISYLLTCLRRRKVWISDQYFEEQQFGNPFPFCTGAPNRKVADSCTSGIFLIRHVFIVIHGTMTHSRGEGGTRIIFRCGVRPEV